MVASYHHRFARCWSSGLVCQPLFYHGDMFPKSTVATITGIGTMAGGIGSFLINKGSGMLFTYAEGQGSAFTFMGFDGKPGAYMIVFCICSVAYLVGWCSMKALVPKYKPIVVE